MHSSLPFRAIMKPSPGGVFSADDVRHFCYQLSSVQQKRDTANEIMNMATRSLLQFLKEARHAHLQFLSSGVESQSPIYVVGNPSVDLDSIISAIVYSYFAHNRTPINSSVRPHVPLINLANVSAGPELRRLRPEFVKALLLCTGTGAGKRAGEEEEGWEDTPESAGEMLRKHIVTVQDFARQVREKGFVRGEGGKCRADAVMVDWNAMPVRVQNQKGHGSLDGLSSVIFRVLGCIDHHVDEGFLPSAESLQPLVVKPAGSCTSHVVNTLRHEQPFWQGDKKVEIGEAQVAQLALAAILIDTANLTAKDKVTDSDTDAFAFLAPKVNRPNTTTEQAHTTSTSDVITPYYEQVLQAKQNSLDLLTVDEILVRDYKSWEEKPGNNNTPVKLGFCSTVKSLPWIIRKAGSPQSLLGSLQALSSQDTLDIVVVMSAFSSSSSKKGQFCRELLIVSAADNDNDKAPISTNALNTFISQSSSKLGLVDWSPLQDEDHDNKDIKATLNQDSPQWRRLWVQTNLGMSRKQVAPLLRGAVAGE